MIGLILLGVITLAMFIFLIVAVYIERKRSFEKMLNKEVSIDTACAGSDSPDKEVSACIKVQSLENNVFRKADGEIMDVSRYLPFIVQGESMQYSGINDSDLIFVEKNFKIYNNTSYPVILLLRKYTDDQTKPQFKIRRTWKYTKFSTPDDLLKKVNEILLMPEFQQIRGLSVYDGDKSLITDLMEKRLPAYMDNPHRNLANEVVISTTFHTDEKIIRFSIHPASTIVGKVVAAFPYPLNKYK